MGDLTFGGRAVGLTFNPGNNEEVDRIKKSAANFIDEVCGPSAEKLQIPIGLNPTGDDGEVIAMRKLAQRAAQEAQMWAVKAATWNK